MDKLVVAQPTAMAAPTTAQMIQQVIASGGQAAEMAQVIKELVALRQSEERFVWEREERQSKIDFDDALNACQTKIGRIAPTGKRENGIKWATYNDIDRIIRPIYTAAGFSISFSELESTGRLRMKATLSRGGIFKEYFAEITQEPPNSKMSKADADASAKSRVKRYLVLDIFNIAVGIDADEKKPYVDEPTEAMDEPTVLEWIDAMNQAPNLIALKNTFADCWDRAKKLRDQRAKDEFQKVYEARKRALGGK